MSLPVNPSSQPSDVDQSDLFPLLDIQSTQRIAQLARMHVRDFPMPFQARINTNGVSFRFELPVENIDLNTFQAVLTDGTVPGTRGLIMNQDYTIDPRAGVMLMTFTPTAGLQLQSVGQYYKNFLPGEMDVYVRQAFLMHTSSYDNSPQLDVWPTPGPPNVGHFGIPAPTALPEIEEYPLSLFVASLAMLDAAMEAGQQYDIRTPDGVVIPRNQQYQNLLQMAQLLEQKYKDYSMLLDIGMYRIQMNDLRRVSRTTNRYVPIYRAREYDDLNYPQRVLPPRDISARTVTYAGAWAVSGVYAKDSIVDLAGQRYLSLQAVPAGKSPALDVDPVTGYGYYWAYTSLNSGWFGLW